MATKSEVKAELTTLGVWQDYLRLRDDLKEQGVAPSKAAEQAYQDVTTGTTPAAPTPTPPKTRAEDKVFAYAELAAVAPAGACSEREAASFVFEYAAVPVNQIPQDAVPSKGAVGLLKWVHASPSNAATFYSGIWSKLMPTKSQLDAEARFSDDGSSELEIISRLETSLAETENEIDGGQVLQQVQEGHAPVGVLHSQDEGPEEG